MSEDTEIYLIIIGTFCASILIKLSGLKAGPNDFGFLAFCIPAGLTILLSIGKEVWDSRRGYGFEKDQVYYRIMSGCIGSFVGPVTYGLIEMLWKTIGT